MVKLPTMAPEMPKTMPMVMVMAPGVYRMLIAMQARTEEWLAFLVWALLSGLLVWFCAKPRFRTNLGDRYLDALRREFDAMRDHMHIWGEAAAAHTATLAALFGAVLGYASEKFKVELLCIIDSLDKGMLIYRGEKRGMALPSMRPLHWAKRFFEWLYLRKYR